MQMRLCQCSANNQYPHYVAIHSVDTIHSFYTYTWNIKLVLIECVRDMLVNVEDCIGMYMEIVWNVWRMEWNSLDLVDVVRLV